MKVTIFGTGYVGLVQAAVLADAGHHVICVDVDESKIAKLQRGLIPIYEPGLESLVKTTHADGRLLFTTDAAHGVCHGNILFIAVGTPPDEDGSADLECVLAVAKTIAAHMNNYKAIVNKSTVPVGTADRVADAVRWVLQKRGVTDTFDVVSNPEFMKEGAALADCRRPNRIVIGTSSPRAERLLRELYAPFNRNHDKIILMDVRSAELTKYAANCMLATKISFINEMANLAEFLGADIESVRKGIGSDPRIGYHSIYPGIGYGGSCFPKDVKAIIRAAEIMGFEPKILKAVQARNSQHKLLLFQKIQQHFDGNLKGKTIALWGLAFKPNTDDMREAPSRSIMEQLWAAGVCVQAYDPAAMGETQRIYGIRPNLVLCSSKEAALKGSDALAIATEWQQFQAVDLEMIVRTLKYPVIFDGRNLYDPRLVAESGIKYYAVGRRA